MATKERLHELIEGLPDSEVDAVADFIASRGDEDPVLRAFREAPQDDEPLTTQEQAALAESHAELTAGAPTIPLGQIKRELGDA